MSTELKYQCVALKGELSDWGKHVLMPFGITLCGMPTVDANKESFPQLEHPALNDLISEYTVEEWDITCTKCLNVLDVIEKGNAARKASKNQLTNKTNIHD